MQRPVITAATAAVMLFSAAAFADQFDKDYAEAQALLDKGQRADAGKKYQELEKKLGEAVAAKPNDAHLNFLYGCVYMDGGDDENAAKYLDKAMKLDDKNVEYMVRRGRLFEYNEKPADAIVLYQKAIALDSKNPEHLVSLARAQKVSKQFEAARTTIQKLVAMDPKSPNYLSMLADVYLAEGKTDAAKDIYEQVIKLDPKFVFGYLNLGQLHQLTGKYEESLKFYNKALDIEPSDWRAIAKTVQLYQALGGTKERDAAREKLFALAKAGKVDQPFYCREQYTHGKQKLMVYEHFKLEGEFAVRYAFRFINENGSSDKRISLGSYETTTAIAREGGTIGKDERMFHLDYYFPNGHSTLGMFKKEPTYEESRDMVNKFIDGELTPKSSSNKTGD